MTRGKDPAIVLEVVPKRQLKDSSRRRPFSVEKLILKAIKNSEQKTFPLDWFSRAIEQVHDQRGLIPTRGLGRYFGNIQFGFGHNEPPERISFPIMKSKRIIMPVFFPLPNGNIGVARSRFSDTSAIWSGHVRSRPETNVAQSRLRAIV